MITVRCGDQCMHAIIIGTASDNCEMWGIIKHYNQCMRIIDKLILVCLVAGVS